MEISIVLVSAKMKGNTKPSMGEPGKQHSKVKDCLEERREWGQRSSSLGTALLITAAIYVIYYSSLPPSTIQMAAGQTDHYSHQLYSKLLGAVHLSI